METAMKTLLKIILFSLIIIQPLQSQELIKSLPKKSPMLFFEMEDGTTICGNLINDHIKIQVYFDTAPLIMEVPIINLSSVSFGPRLSDNEEKEFNDNFDRLGDIVWENRNLGTNNLIAMGPRIYFKLLSIKSDDNEIKKRIDIIINQLIDKHGKNNLKEASEDNFVLSKINGFGKIADRSLWIRSKYFGDINVDLSNVRTISIMHHFDAKQLSLSANQEEYIDTGVKLVNNQKIRIRISGHIDLYPQTRGLYMSGPKGAANYNSASSKYKAGTVIIKIGNTEFGYENESISGNGNLLLKVAKNPWNANADGAYNVRISVE